jgi:hypothetical protein
MGSRQIDAHSKLSREAVLGIPGDPSHYLRSWRALIPSQFSEEWPGSDGKVHRLNHLLVCIVSSTRRTPSVNSAAFGRHLEAGIC